MKSYLMVVVFLVVMSVIQGESSTGQGSTVQQQTPKKIRVLGPAASRLYRALHNGGGINGGGDDEEIFVDDENYLQKRQYDDYGHMRFGKRQSKGDFDDYGHLRFGK